MKTRRLLSLIACLLCIFSYSTVFATIKKTEIGTRSGAIVSQSAFSTANTTYIINYDITLSGEVTVPSGCTLLFSGGSVSGGTLQLTDTEVCAPDYQIFKSVRIKGSFANSHISAHWWGAKGDGNTDDSKAINSALEVAGKSTVMLPRQRYLVNSPIKINRLYSKLECAGTILTTSDIAILELSSQYLDIKVRQLRYGKTNGVTTDRIGTGVSFRGNVFNSNISIDRVMNLQKGFDFTPDLADGRKLSGSQYNKVSWQYIDCRYCIFIDLWKDPSIVHKVWVNENQFFGGRMSGEYGVYVKENSIASPENTDYINGNVFNCIGFEGIVTPVSLFFSRNNRFNDCRMSEGISGDKWIILKDCGFCSFDIKSMFPYNRLSTTNCSQVVIENRIVDSGMGGGSGFNRLIANGNTVFAGTELPQCNMMKQLYYNSTTNQRISFNDLFVSTYDHQMVLSDMCKIIIDKKMKLTVDLKDSVYKLHPRMTLVCSIFNGATIDIAIGNKVYATISQLGKYIITYDRDSTPIVVAM